MTERVLGTRRIRQLLWNPTPNIQYLCVVSRPLRVICDLDDAPPGVVFEVVGWDPTALKHVIPQVTVYAERLRARFPDLPVAVVTHGSEQFSLLASEKGDYEDLHAQVQALSGEQDVAVHVCGNHASWRGKTAGDFPDYVDVAVAAAEKMGEYRGLGYLVIHL